MSPLAHRFCIVICLWWQKGQVSLYPSPTNKLFKTYKEANGSALIISQMTDINTSHTNLYPHCLIVPKMNTQTSMGAAVAAVMLVCFVWIRHKPYPSIDEPFQRTSLREALARNDSGENGGNLVTKESEYPPEWWTSTEVLDIERRAIFSKVRIFLNLSN